MSQPLKILLIAAEINPIAKVGGLADVVGALPKALHQLGIDVKIVIPKYGAIDENKYPSQLVTKNITVPFNGKDESVSIYQTPLPDSDVPIYLIDHPHYLGENGIYFDKAEAVDNPLQREAERFMFFSRASLEVPSALDWQPDVIHCQDWHVGFVPVLTKILAKEKPELKDKKILHTIHNLEYQGWYKPETVFKAFGVTADDHPALSNLREGQIVSMRQAILTADELNTVSETYAEEILTKEYGAGLEKDLTTRKENLVGILNGIDVNRFDPATDPAIPAQFSVDNVAGKAVCKMELQKKVGLAVEADSPLIGIITRLADQKGIDLLDGIIDRLAQQKAQLVLLGTGQKEIEDMMRAKAEKYPEMFSAHIEFNADFAQLIYAGSDMFLMPSRYEPCGLGQMIAMRYGTVPIVRATGGLKDTVADYDDVKQAGDGFSFNEYTADAFWEAVSRALELYKNQKAWHTVVAHIMRKDFSWTASAKKYQALYQRLLKS